MMKYEEFEWHVLRMVYEKGLERIDPAYIAYALGIPHEKASEYLDRAAENGVLELDFTEDGSIEYFVPGIDPGDEMPDPVWKKGGGAPDAEEAGDGVERIESGAGRSESARAVEPKAESDRSGHLPPPDGAEPPTDATGAAEEPAVAGADGAVDRTDGSRRADAMPAPIESHVQNREAAADGSVETTAHGPSGKVLDREARAEEDKTQVVAALEESDRDLPIHIESTDETFSDPSQTIFMRQLRVEGVESESALREHIQRLFDSLGYRVVESNDERMRFERGSVTFVLALVPLFVLVLPLFVYLFLYCMGRSTIHQEPLELDVQLRKSGDRDDAYDIDLTFIGLHGVVLGSADQRVLDKEVDTLRDELRWALTTG